MALVHCNFFSETLGTATSMDVLLPESTVGQVGMAGHRKTEECPTLFLLHGWSDDHTIWQRRTSIERYVAPLGLAVIMPNVHLSYYTNMKHGGRYWDFVSEELPAKARQFFRLSSAREKTFVAGLSMGGYGAFKLALRRPDLFCAGASLSGALDVVALATKADDKRKKAWQPIFGTDLGIAGTVDDLFWCASEYARSPAPAPAVRLYQGCGTEDYLYADNLRFRDHVRRENLDLTYEEGPGEHEWGFWDLWIQRVLAWLPLSPSRRPQENA